MTDIPNQTQQETTPVGKILRAARESRGLTLAQIAEKLKLSVRQLTALEENDFQALPGNTFVRGFVRNYARELEIDPQPLLDQLSEFLPQERVQVAMPKVGEATALNTVLRVKTDGNTALTGLMVVLGLVLGAGVVFWYLQKPTTPEVAIVETPTAIEFQAPTITGSAPELASEADSAASAPAVASQPSIASMPVASMAVAKQASVPVAIKASAVQASKVAASKPALVSASMAQGNAIRVAAEFDSWVQIVDADDHILVSQLLTPGTERSVSGKPPFRIKIGNAPKTRLFYRGKPVDLAPYAKADVATLELK